ncbi:MAG: hypothetical protein QM582_10380 [Micropruina sp.]|uniref:hypothetical protein n=1 Tax=Micropruina sp. TaxID=2737536 RepID=UPI0039E60ECF
MVWLTVAKAAIVVVLAAIGVLAGGRVVLAVFRLAERSPARELEGDPEAAQQSIGQLTRAAATLRGGQWIGMLERLAVFATLLAGFGEGLAVAMVLKGFARYPELKASSTGAAERFIIGTFVSVLFASGCAGLAIWLTSLF